jgi:hypothetical protein
MQATKEIEKKYSQYLLVGAILAILVGLYFFVWFRIRKAVLNGINSDDRIKYDKISSGGFPLFIKSKLTNVKLSFANKNSEVIFEVDEILIKNLMFTRSVSVSFVGNIYIKLNGKTVSLIKPKNSIDTNLTLKKNFKIDRLDTIIDEVEINDIDEKNKNYITANNKFKGVVVRVIGIDTEDYSNVTARIEINQILTKFLDKNVEIENNFEVVVSNTREVNFENKIVSSKIVLDTFVFNDITNNYSISAKGEYEIDTVAGRSAKSQIDFKISNYNSLLAAVNSKDSYLIVNKNSLSNILQMLELMPMNLSNTRSEKHYKLEFDSKSNKITINGGDMSSIIEKYMFGK